MTKLKEIIDELRTLIADEAGVTKHGRMALGVGPDRVKQAATGMTIIVQRIPRAGRGTTEVTGGKYFEDLYEVHLINQMRSDAQRDDSKKLATAKRKIEIAFTLRGCMYIAETDDRPEQVHITIFSPSLECP